MELTLSGKVAMVTGASKGIGRAISQQMASAGAKIIAVSRSEDELGRLIKELPGEGHHLLSADFSKPDYSLSKLGDYITKNPLDILVNNTGGPPPGQIHEADWGSFLKALEMHLRMSQGLVQAVLPGMRSKNFGRIINVISTSTKIPIAGLGVSNTVRGAMNSWSKTLASEVAKDGITVNNILPGFISTGRLDSLIESKAIKSGKSKEDVISEMQASIPSGRFGRPEELGFYATFLASDLGSYINGTSLQIDGGRTGSL